MVEIDLRKAPFANLSVGSCRASKVSLPSESLRERAFFFELFDAGEKRIYDPSDWRP
jgi:hypothetical protein